MGEMIIKPRMWDEKIASYANNGRTSSNVRAAALQQISTLPIGTLPCKTAITALI